MPRYTDCPHCRRPGIRINKDDCMRQHRMDTGYLAKGTLFPHCPYGGCTIREARDGITALMKRRMEYERRGGVEAAKLRFLKRQERLRKKNDD